MKNTIQYMIMVSVPAILSFLSQAQVTQQLAEGLQTGTLKEARIDSARIMQMEDELAKGKHNIHGILVLRDDKLVFEKYFPGKDEIFARPVGIVDHSRDSLHDCRSITKSVVSACIGIAIEQKKIKGVNDKIFSYFPEYAKYDTGSKRELTIKHLLTMSDGLQWNENIPYNNPENSEIQMLFHKDPVDFVLSRPLVSKPGSAWNYSGGTTQLLAALLEKVTGQKVDSFANKHIFSLLGIRRFYWYKREDGTPWAPSGLRLRPIDMAKFGLLYLNGGKWNAVQVIPSEWARESISPQVRRGRPSQAYGYQFWCVTDSNGKKDTRTALAIGYGGQRIYLVPRSDVVIVVTAGNYDQHSDLSDEVIDRFIFPAIKE